MIGTFYIILCVCDMNYKKTIKYFGFYDVADSACDRVSNLAAVNKMNYIAACLNKAGHKVKFVSPSWMGDESQEKFKWFESRQVNEGVEALFFPSWRTRTKLFRNLKIIFSLVALFVYMILSVRRSEKIIVYHVPWLSLPVRFAKKIKGFSLVLEVEEIYKDVSTINRYFEVLEDDLLACADSYIVSTELLEHKVCSEQGECIVLYGNYDVMNDGAEKFTDGLIHLVYAGIIDSHKKGAFNALEAMRFLPPNYVLHILGFGETERLNAAISKITTEYKCKVIYEGIKKGDDFKRFCASCHIGLSTQSMDGDYLLSSFPSKILTYLGIGLNVVSCNVKCVRISKIGDLVDYYDIDKPEAIAETIQKVRLHSATVSRDRLFILEQEFIGKIKTLFN